MANVRILPEILSNKIAAGEVVERPSSVVKELVENALDARSTLIIIDIENGGRSLVRISDNGSGMGRDDALLSIERYATSKLYEDKDLFFIKTLGFRGEALPSIASVSRFSLTTREKNSDIGIHILMEGGKIKKVQDVGVAPGTVISVEQLFFNTPARRKFLKSTTTEMGHIMDTVASMALGWPGVQFRLSHNGKAVKSWPQATGFYDRAVDVLGQDLNNSLHDVTFDDDYLALSGLVSSPDMTRSNTQKIFIFINGRHIRDRGLIHAILSAYGSRLMKGRFPVAVLFLKIPFDQLDVNVHPTKHEVRFVDHNRIYRSVQLSVARALEQCETRMLKKIISPSIPVPGPKAQPPVQRSLPVRETSFISTVHDPIPGYIGEKEISAFKTDALNGKTPDSGMMVKEADRFVSPRYSAEKIPPVTQETPIRESRFFRDLKIIGQLHRSYIICESEDGLIIIDQHAAHERIVFEELKKKATRVQSQALLIPETLELGYKEAAALERVLDGLAHLGLEIEPFGQNTFAVKSCPSILSQGMITNLVIEIAEKLVEIGSSAVLEKALDDCLILMACHGAVRANQSLNEKQISHLLGQMDACESPSFCPHGRPTWTRYSRLGIEKAFKR